VLYPLCTWRATISTVENDRRSRLRDTSRRRPIRCRCYARIFGSTRPNVGDDADPTRGNPIIVIVSVRFFVSYKRINVRVEQRIRRRRYITTCRKIVYVYVTRLGLLQLIFFFHFSCLLDIRFQLGRTDKLVDELIWWKIMYGDRFQNLNDSWNS